ncbi:MAG TPA: Xaa-Pro peptidase family protein [Thermomicrobiaceae bacterium]|nr:Xaa-Pro peptidase family protein [Thermomicrobiaceae bacterium]
MDFTGRLATLRQRMEADGVDVLFLTRGANLFYLAGVRRQLEHGTDHNAFGDWACGAYIGRTGGLVLVAPRMGGRFFESEAVDKPWIDRVRLIQESEDPLAVMRQTIADVAPGARSAAIDDRAWTQTSLAIRELLPEAADSLASTLVMPMRTIKDADEVAAMRRASEVADLVWERVTPFLKVGVTEYEVAREVDYQFQLAGAEYTSFVTGITFFGPAGVSRGGLLRATAGRALHPGDSITFDFGCVFDGYCSDFGRSAFVGEPSPEYLRVHDVVLQAQAAGIQAMRAGQITGAEVNAIARQVIADAGYDAHFTHRLGHAIGVTVHEAPPTLDVVDHTVLQENMMFTVEPSVFIPGRLGNRVEDVVMVTQEGGVPLNRASHALQIVGA